MAQTGRLNNAAARARLRNAISYLAQDITITHDPELLSYALAECAEAQAIIIETLQVADPENWPSEGVK